LPEAAEVMMMNSILFKNKVEMRNFAYEGQAGMDEETVKDAVAAFLKHEGYTVFAGKKREKGVDIQARKEPEKLVVEAKGEGSRNEMFNNFFVAALGQIVQRRSMNATDYGVALPAHSKYIRLIDELDDLFVRYQLRLNFYLVGRAGSQVGFLRHDVK
jgi:hypothetical protein